jgi:two-component system, NtrC family, nitrogen regulation sensor histidine kinase NtrY
MKLRTKYILFVAILHIVALLLSYFIFDKNKIFFIVSEVFIIISLIISWQLYNELIHPIDLLMQGADAIKDRDFNVKFLSTGKYEMDKLIKVYNEMMDELRTERTKQEEQHLFLEKLIYTSPTGILILDFNENIHQVNPRALQLLGVEEKEVLKKSVYELSHPIMQQVKQLQSGHSKMFTMNGAVSYKLQKSHFIDRGFPRHFVMIEELTAEILEAEKKSYGKVIRMMAHEVNNTIGSVNSILQFTLQAQQHSDELTNAIQVAIERNNNLNSFMRNFADLVRIPIPVKRPVHIIPLLQNVTDLMQLRAGEKKINFQYEHHNEAFIINADIQQMEQALINIVKNAVEAIDEKGTISIITRANPKQLIIRDSGKGISPESEEYLFSPFYSTKKDGQGVGLTVIREILFNHGFDFSLKTVAMSVTEFRINFG